MRKTASWSLLLLLLGFALVLSVSSSSVYAQSLPKVTIVVFEPPSLGAFLPPIIKRHGFDRQNGVEIEFVERTTDAYNAEFAAGHYPLGGSAALLSEGLRINRGVKVTYLFNLFDFFGALVTSDPNIQSLADLTGKTMAAARVTTNYAMFRWFAQRMGVDLNKVDVLNVSTPGLVTYAMTDRADAVQLWEPAYSTLLYQRPDLRTIDFGLNRWKEFTGAETMPYLGVAAHQDWANQNPDLVRKVYDTYKMAADWVLEHPAKAAQIIAATIPNGDPWVIQDLLENNDRLQLRVAPASQIADDIQAVFTAGLEIGYYDARPDDSVIYKGLP